MPSVAFVVPEMLPVPPLEGGALSSWVHEIRGHRVRPPVFGRGGRALRRRLGAAARQEVRLRFPLFRLVIELGTCLRSLGPRAQAAAPTFGAVRAAPVPLRPVPGPSSKDIR